MRQEARTIQSVKIRRGQGAAAPPRSEPRGRGGDEAAEAEGINEAGCNMCERITTPKILLSQRPTVGETGRQHCCPSLSARWQRLCRGSWLERAFWHVLMLRDGVFVNLGDLLDSDLLRGVGRYAVTRRYE